MRSPEGACRPVLFDYFARCNTDRHAFDTKATYHLPIAYPARAGTDDILAG